MAKHKNFRHFLKRLKRLRHKAVPKSLSKLISNSELSKIFDLFDLTKQIKIIDALSEQADAKIKILNEIEKLLPGNALHFPPEKTGLARTINVLRLESGRYELYLETENLLANNQTQELPEMSGTVKKGMPAWRLGVNYTERFNLTVTFCSNLTQKKIELENKEKQASLDFNEVIELVKAEDKYLDFKDELKFNRLVKHKKYVIDYKEGPTFVSHNMLKGIMYCRKAIGTLEDVISQVIPTSKAQRFLLSEKILKGLRAIHKSNIAHQDLKPKNILIFSNSKNELTLKIADFGLSEFHKCKEAYSCCTPLYHSPEISLSTLYMDPSTLTFQTYHTGRYACTSYSNQIIYNTDSTQFVIRRSFDYPHKLHDSWSAGVTIYELYTLGKHPNWHSKQNEITSNPLLNGLLKVERTERVTANQALHIFKRNKTMIFSKLEEDLKTKINSKRFLLLPEATNQDIDQISEKMHVLRLSTNDNYKSETNRPKYS